MMRLLLTTALVAITISCSASFQPCIQHAFDIKVRRRTPPATRAVRHHATPSSLKLPPRGGNAPLAVAARGVVNGDKTATFGVDESLAKSLSVIVATFATYVLHNHLFTGMGPVLASGVVAIASTLLLPENLALAALCGSFAGMAKVSVVPTPVSAGILGVVCAAVMRLFDKKAWLIGFGGRLGFIAQCACTLQFLVFKYGQKVWDASPIVGSALGSTAPTAMLADFSVYEMTSVAQIKAQVPPLLLFTVAGAFFMRLWKRLTAKLPNKVSNSVAAVGMTGLLGGAYLPTSMAAPAFCGSFVAMSSVLVLPSLLALLLACVLAGLSQLGLTGLLLGGWGGKLGTAAFLGVVAYRFMIRATNNVASVLSAKSQDRGIKTAAASNPSEV